MNTLQRGSIVVGVDEVALAGQAVRWAGEQAALEGRRILLVRAASAVTTGWSTHAMDVPPGTFTSQRLHGDSCSAAPATRCTPSPPTWRSRSWSRSPTHGP